MKQILIAFILSTFCFCISINIYGQNFINHNKMNVYFISGLGADQRVFEKLKIDDRFNVIHIKWIDPLKKESLESYANRLSTVIDTTKPYQIVGLSFGGMVATMIAEQQNPEQIILVSSSSVGMPLGKFYRGLINFLLLSPLSSPFLKSANKFTYKFFGANTNEEKILLKNILKDTDAKFLKWALKTISKWDHPVKSPKAYQINGSADKMIQPRFVQADRIVKGGEHLMIYSKADELSEIINAQLIKKFKED